MLNDEESAKLAMSEAATKVSDLKRRLNFKNPTVGEVSSVVLLFCLLLFNLLAGILEHEEIHGDLQKGGAETRLQQCAT